MKNVVAQADDSTLNALLEMALAEGLIEKFDKGNDRVLLWRGGERYEASAHCAQSVVCCLLYDHLVRLQTQPEA